MSGPAPPAQDGTQRRLQRPPGGEHPIPTSARAGPGPRPNGTHETPIRCHPETRPVQRSPKATIRTLRNPDGTVLSHVVEGDFHINLLIPLEAHRPLAPVGRQKAPPVEPPETEIRPSVIPVVSYDRWTADEEFQAAEDFLLEASSADNVLEQPLEISPGMLHLTQPYLPKDVRHQPLLVATQGGSRVAAGHRWARHSRPAR